MNYEQWREDLFGQPPDSDPVMVELRDETYALSKELQLDYIDRALLDPDIHTLFNKNQIGIGLQIIYSNSCSDIPFCYINDVEENRRITAFNNLRYLYTNYFEKYCISPVDRVGYNLEDGAIGYLCYMFWDIFPLYHGNATQKIVDAAVAVMQNAIKSKNDNCIVSGLHGLGHWASKTPPAIAAIETWLKMPSTNNPAVLEYARQAKTGCVQ